MVINQPEELPQQKFPLDRDRIRSAFEQMIRWDNEFNEAETADDRFKAGQMSVGGVGILSALGLHDTFIATQRTIDLHGHIDEALPTDASYEFTADQREDAVNKLEAMNREVLAKSRIDRIDNRVVIIPVGITQTELDVLTHKTEGATLIVNLLGYGDINSEAKDRLKKNVK